MPGFASIAPAHLVCVIDTSASMDDKALAVVGAELQSILDDGGADAITVVQCDTQVHSVETYGNGDILNTAIHGRGGTAFAPAFQWVRDNAPDASALVYLTDMDSDAWGEPPACHVLWAATERPRHAPFGEIVRVDAYA
jgi:predicted metal-dependent peptidase